tara:strand:+ start:2267 stop:2728 length:462 start_codon:yes stop_codon:yes gene_type:complete
MKTFKQHLSEHSTMHSGTRLRGYEDQEAWVGASEALEALNSVVGAVGEQEVMNPRLAVKRIREDIARLGYQMDNVEIDPNGTTFLAVRGADTFDCTYDESPMEGQFYSSDTASESIPGGISLMVSVTPTGTGKHSVIAEIVRNSDLEEEDDMA